jgi:hypothetical protein
MAKRVPFIFPAVLCAGAVILAGCASEKEAQQPEPREVIANNSSGNDGGILNGLISSVTKGGAPSNENITVNSYLWRASLDTVSFLPLSTADPFGGVIITDWYSPPKTPNERFKVTVYILDRQLRADGLRVSVFRQTRTPSSAWVEAKVDPRTERDLENAILKRARQMRIRGGAG